MTTELIKELVGLAVEKSAVMATITSRIVIVKFNAYGRLRIDLCDPDSPAQLQAAIDKVKSL